jgi:hypothetical protein
VATLGIVRFHHDGRAAVARLDDDLAWTVDAPFEHLAAELNSAYPPDSYSPADGVPGRKILCDAAELLRGNAEWIAPHAPVADDAVL